MTEKRLVMISQPMAGKTKKEIANERNEMSKLLNKLYPDNYEILDTTVKDYELKSDLECFAESINFLAHVDVLVMGIGWEYARGCRLEHEIAVKYGVKVLYLDDNPFIYGIYHYTQPSCQGCPSLRFGDICKLEYANNLIDEQREEIKKLNERIRRMKMELMKNDE